MESILEKLFIGMIGGLIAFWLAQRKFISQRWWDKKFDLYIDAIEILEHIEHSLGIFVWAVERKQTIDDSEIVNTAYADFEEGLGHLHGLQSKMMLIGLDEAHKKLMVLRAALSAVHPSFLTSDTEEDTQEILELLKQSKNMTGGCSGELAFLGRRKLGTGWRYLVKIKEFFRNKLNPFGSKGS